MKEIGFFYLVLQLLAFPATWLMGVLGNRFNEMKVFSVTIFIWIIVVILLSICDGIPLLIFITVLTSFVIGSSKSILRSIYSKLIIKENSSIFFSFFSIFSRSASVIGPILFGIISTQSQNQRVAILYPIIPLTIILLLVHILTKKQHIQLKIKGRS